MFVHVFRKFVMIFVLYPHSVIASVSSCIRRGGIATLFLYMYILFVVKDCFPILTSTMLLDSSGARTSPCMILFFMVLSSVNPLGVLTANWCMIRLMYIQSISPKLQTFYDYYTYKTGLVKDHTLTFNDYLVPNRILYSIGSTLLLHMYNIFIEKFAQLWSKM